MRMYVSFDCDNPSIMQDKLEGFFQGEGAVLSTLDFGATDYDDMLGEVDDLRSQLSAAEEEIEEYENAGAAYKEKIEGLQEQVKQLRQEKAEAA